MNILITGAGGLIGGEVLRAFQDSKHQITGIFRTTPINFKSRAELTYADLSNSQSDSVLQRLNPDCVVHCAAQMPASFDGEYARRAAEENSFIDHRIRKFCESKSIRLVYCSSTSVYGLPSIMVSENSPTMPAGPYPREKLGMEKALSESGLPAVILRINAPYGVRQKANTVLKIFVENALSNLDLTYHGTGSRCQDFTSVHDVGRAIQYAVAKKHVRGIINISAGSPISMRSLAELVVSCVPFTKSKITSSGIADAQEHYRALFDISRARDLLDWSPAVSLGDGIRAWLSELSRATK